ncbi:MAG: UDP-N-acetylmuramoyl-tripeptide--D-alanyl-D-alanine ligase, partial [Burkholderiales bacterium]
HAEVGQYARERGVDRLLTLGEMTRLSVTSFGRGGEHFTDVESLMERLNGLPANPATILVKGSRFMRMERVVAQLLTGAPACS